MIHYVDIFSVTVLLWALLTQLIIFLKTINTIFTKLIENSIVGLISLFQQWIGFISN